MSICKEQPSLYIKGSVHLSGTKSKTQGPYNNNSNDNDDNNDDTLKA
jgi:hypothetical protein